MKRISVTTSTSTIKWEEFQKNHDSSSKNIVFFEKFKIFKISKIIWIFSKIFEIFRTPQNRFIVVGFQLTIFCTLGSNLWSRRGTKNRALTPPSGQYFDNYAHKVVSYIPMLVCARRRRDKFIVSRDNSSTFSFTEKSTVNFPNVTERVRIPRR